MAKRRSINCHVNQSINWLFFYYLFFIIFYYVIFIVVYNKSQSTDELFNKKNKKEKLI